MRCCMKQLWYTHFLSLRFHNILPIWASFSLKIFLKKVDRCFDCCTYTFYTTLDCCLGAWQLREYTQKNALKNFLEQFLRIIIYAHLKLIICYIISSGPTKPSKYCWGQQWVPPSWLVNYFGHCLLLSNQFFVLVYLLLLVYRNLILTISAQMQTSAQFKFALYIYNKWLA